MDRRLTRAPGAQNGAPTPSGLARATAADVARAAGVSQSAVSRAFTKGASVSAETAAKVRKAADALGYRPNVLARSLITGRSRVIGLVVAYLENYFYPSALEKLSKKLREHGYHIMVFIAGQESDACDAPDIDDVLIEILDHQVAGLILASVETSSDLASRCQTMGVPVVLFNRSQDDDRLSAVTSDNMAGGRKLARFLAAGGHERIAYIAGDERASTQRDREAGFRAGLAEAGLALFGRENGAYRADQARAACLRLFSKPVRPDAVFVANDHMAFAVMDALRFELGLRTPEDVSVVGYDDVRPAAWPAYNLTTVRQPANKMADATVQALLAQIDGGETAPLRVAIEGPLVVRASARIPTGWPA